MVTVSEVALECDNCGKQFRSYRTDPQDKRDHAMWLGWTRDGVRDYCSACSRSSLRALTSTEKEDTDHRQS